MSAHLSKENLLRYLKRSISPSHLIEIDAHISGCSECQLRLATLAGEKKSITQHAARPDNLASDHQLFGFGGEQSAGSMTHENPTEVLGEIALASRNPAPHSKDLSPQIGSVVSLGSSSPTNLAEKFIRSLPPVPPTTSGHLSYEQLEACVDNKLKNGELRAVCTHLEGCQSCMEELADLHRFAADVSKGSRSRVPRRMILTDFWKALSSWFTFRRSVLVGVLASLVLFAIMPRTHIVNAPPPKQAAGNPGTKIEIAVNQGATIFDPGIMAGTSYDVAPLFEKPHYSFPSLSDLDGLDPKIWVTIIGSIESDHSETLVALRNLTNKRHSLSRGLDGKESPQLLSPVGAFALSATPTFRWAARAGVDGYTVHVYDSEFNAVESSPVVTAREWKSNVALRSGRTYQWRVQATKNGEAVSEPITNAPLGRFRILDSSQRKLITELRRSRPEAHLTIGILLARGGVIDDAVKEFEAVPQSDPNYASAQKFLKDLEHLQVTVH